MRLDFFNKSALKRLLQEARMSRISPYLMLGIGRQPQIYVLKLALPNSPVIPTQRKTPAPSPAWRRGGMTPIVWMPSWRPT
jgi:hypothetical protein